MTESETALCRLADLPDGGARGFTDSRGFSAIFAIRRGDDVRVYVNSCPHIGVPLELIPDRFLDNAGMFIICATHGAQFRIQDGVCVSGPCQGQALEPVPVRIAAGTIWIPEAFLAGFP